MRQETILTNTILALPQETVSGTVVLHGTTIRDVQPGRSHVAAASDLDGDILIPGVVDLHTDNLERQVAPRANARWPSRSAMIAHDAQCAAAGITTVLDALCVGDLGYEPERTQTFRDAVSDLDALADTGLLKATHFLHLRCELPAVNLLEQLEPVADHARARIVSLMDHSPGVGQYADLDRYRALRRREGLEPNEIEHRIIRLQEQRQRLRASNRRALLARVFDRAVVLASHDDRTEQDIAENHADCIAVSEFPVTMAAAKAAKAHGMSVIAGAPNIVRGGSHYGNVGAADLMRAGVVNALASDYVPSSLIVAAFNCAADSGTSLPEAVGLVTEGPARLAGLADRGRIAAGMRADVVRIRQLGALPVVRQVWRAGERVI